eukprot:5908230-Prymnesium_polylepis.2
MEPLRAEARICGGCGVTLQNGQDVNENITTSAPSISRSSRASTADCETREHSSSQNGEQHTMRRGSRGCRTASNSPATNSATHCLKPARRVEVSSESRCGSESASAHALGSPFQPSASSSGSRPSRRASST